MAKDKKWIQKAVNPKHKGFCTPMTKKTCTPRRKALAKTFKKKARTGWAMGGMTPTAGEQPYTGSYIQGDLGGVKVGNPSLRSFYGSKIMP